MTQPKNSAFPSRDSPPVRGSAVPRPMPAKGKPSHAEQALDEALKESFPASDPVAVSIDKKSGTAQ